MAVGWSVAHLHRVCFAAMGETSEGTSSDMAGTIVGNYCIVDELGEGGMGMVYLAEHTLIGRKAAIKTLHPELSSEDEVVHRFFNEAKAVTAIKHPGIVEIYDFGTRDDGTAYIVMEYLIGDTLKERLAKVGRLPVHKALEITRQAASALGAAHRAGIIHRDLKPDNVFLVDDPEIGERVKLVDFGIAKILGADDHSVHRTRTGMVMGTPLYMSPEQCRGAGKVDARADFYSLGCILYELLCGQPPFVREGLGAVLGAHMYEQPAPPHSLEPSLEPAVDAFVLRLMAKEPGDRFADASDLVKALPRASEATGGYPAVPAAQWQSGPHSVPPGPHTPHGGMPGQHTPHGGMPGQHAPHGGVPGQHTPHGGVPEQQGAPAGQTTLSGSSVAVRAIASPGHPASHSRSYGWIIALVAVILVVGISGVAWYANSLDDGQAGSTDEVAAAAPAPQLSPDPAPAVSQDPAPATAAPPEATPAPPPEPTPASSPEELPPAKIVIHIKSTPPGAKVYQRGKKRSLGKTPLEHSLEPAGEELALVVKKRGYKDHELTLAGDRNGEATIELVKKKRNKTGAKDTGKTETSAKTGKPGKKDDKPAKKPAETKSGPKDDELEKGGHVDPF